MIKDLENGIVCLCDDNLNPSHIDAFYTTLQSKDNDAVIDLNENYSDVFKARIQPLYDHQIQKNKLLVLVISSTVAHHFPETWPIVPTLTEAVDYIQFEQMQRDLGF